MKNVIKAIVKVIVSFVLIIVTAALPIGGFAGIIMIALAATIGNYLVDFIATKIKVRKENKKLNA